MNLEDRPSIALALIRVVVGVVFVASGISKLAQHAQTAHDFRHWGIPAPSATSVAVPLLEIACGVVLVLGVLPRLAALVLACDMAVALATAGRIDGGMRVAVPGVLLLLCLIVTIGGGGRWALVDRLDPAPPRRLVRS